MNATTSRATQLRRRLAQVQEMALQLRVEREIVIRRHGVAHPRSIAAARRLHHAQNRHRRLQRMHRISVSDDARIRIHRRA